MISLEVVLEAVGFGTETLNPTAGRV